MVPAASLAWIEPLDGVATMLELGDKCAKGQPPYKDWFESIGIRHTSVDWNGLHGALPLDLRQPLNLGRFDMVTNIGTTEHVSEQEPCWRNIAEATGKWFVSMTPCPGYWPRHGFWYPAPDFYRSFADLNG